MVGDRMRRVGSAAPGFGSWAGSAFGVLEIDYTGMPSRDARLLRKFSGDEAGAADPGPIAGPVAARLRNGANLPDLEREEGFATVIAAPPVPYTIVCATACYHTIFEVGAESPGFLSLPRHGGGPLPSDRIEKDTDVRPDFSSGSLGGRVILGPDSVGNEIGRCLAGVSDTGETAVFLAPGAIPNAGKSDLVKTRTPDEVQLPVPNSTVGFVFPGASSALGSFFRVAHRAGRDFTSRCNQSG
jgi:hypothetical protein